MEFSENKMIELAKSNSKELARILTNPTTGIFTLIPGLEILGGEVLDEDVVLPVFRLLINHRNATVRESVLIGISAFFINKTPPKDILDKLEKMAESDPSPTIKEITKDYLKNF